MVRCKCFKCGHEWDSMTEEPRTCARCKSYAWNEAPQIVHVEAIPDDFRGKPCKFGQISPCSEGLWFCPKNKMVYCEAHIREMMDAHGPLRKNQLCYHPEI